VNLAEEAVLEYLTHDGDVFVCPQYRAPGGNPDFVALDFIKHQVTVVEVSTAYGLGNLRDKLKRKDWIDSVRQELKKKGVIDDGWRLIVRVFVAAAYKSQLENDKAEDLEIETIDHVFECLLDWQKKFTREAQTLV
jgi:predicted RNA binding protein with dsRBD fold (UPF0201 family)